MGVAFKSSRLDWDFPLQTIIFGDPPFSGNPHMGGIGGTSMNIPAWLSYFRLNLRRYQGEQTNLHLRKSDAKVIKSP